MNKDYPMQTVDREDAPILGSVLPFPKDGEDEPQMTDFPLQTTVDGEDTPVLGSVLPFPKEGEKNPKMDGFPLQTTIEGEEDSPFSDAIFDVIYYSALGVFSMIITALVVHLLVQWVIGG